MTICFPTGRPPVWTARWPRHARLLARLAALPPEPLSAAEAIDRDLAAGVLEIQAWEMSGPHMHRGNPSLALGEAVFGAIALVLRPFAPLPRRLESLTARLEAVPPYLEQVQRLIQHAPAAWSARAMRECEGMRHFLSAGLDRLLRDEQVDAPLPAPGGRPRDRSGDGIRGVPAGAAGGRQPCLWRRGADLAGTARPLAHGGPRYHPGHGRGPGSGGRSIPPGACRGLRSGDLARSAGATGVTAPDRRRVSAALSGSVDRRAGRGDDRRPCHAGRTTRFATCRNMRWARDAAPYLYFLPYRAPAAFDEVSPMEYLVPPIDAGMPAGGTAAAIAGGERQCDHPESRDPPRRPWPSCAELPRVPRRVTDRQGRGGGLRVTHRHVLRRHHGRGLGRLRHGADGRDRLPHAAAAFLRAAVQPAHGGTRDRGHSAPSR